jgi:hypothetical protein
VDEPFTLLSNVAISPEAAELARALSSAFSMGRYAWPEPWPTRLGPLDQDPGGQLVHVTLKPEAWLAVAAVGNVYVYDAERHTVATADALAQPERIGVIYFDSSRISPGGCEATQGYRGFLLGNLSMIQEWSIGTQQIADRVQSNIDQLTQFLTAIRACPVTTDGATWAQSVLCGWFMQPGADGVSDVSVGTADTGSSGNGGSGGASGGGSSGGGASGSSGGGASGSSGSSGGGASGSSGGGTAGAGGFGGGGAGIAGSNPAGNGGMSAAAAGTSSEDVSPLPAGGVPAQGTGGAVGGISSSAGAAGASAGADLSATEIGAYGQALASPDADYLAAPAQIATIIETLQGDLFVPDPLVVTPGSP